MVIIKLYQILTSFFDPHLGQDYSLNWFKKTRLLLRFILNTKRIPTASSWYEHMLIASRILSYPKSRPGIIVECGVYKGGSAVNLSLICKLTGRKLLVFDSFVGLPQPTSADTRHHCPQLEEIHTYTKGAFRGRLREVKNNLNKYGNLSVCSFVPGYFSASLPEFIRSNQDKIICVFADVDLVNSLKTCLKYLWPLLIPGGYFFTHEAHHLEIAALFYNRKWWQKNLHQSIPGLTGMPFTALGFARKSGYKYRTLPQIVNK